jgi:outer membrane receptor for ferrienterochelin and colicins
MWVKLPGRSVQLALSTALIAVVGSAHSAEPKQDYFALSLDQLASIKVITSSRREQSVDDAYANITVITKEMIARRGYRNIIEMLEDIAGFDFATYEDGGGEYPVHFLNRGIGGDNGNSRLLIMIDGLVQNHISFNWAQGFTDEQILMDIERIEVIQGPGSSLYGAQAVSGMINIITKQRFKGTDIKLLLGENNTQTFELMTGDALGDIHYQLAIKSHTSDGDGGLGRPDPGNYFSDNLYPDILTQSYDSNGVFQTNASHPLAGQAIADGFNNSKDDMALRFKVFSDNMLLGINYWEKKDGLGSYVVGYEYDATAADFLTHHSAYTAFMKNTSTLIENKLNWKTDLWYRIDKQESDTGFRYLYRFNDLKKSYHSSSSQVGFENQFDFKIEQDKTLIFGVRLLGNRQTEQVVSLGQIQSGNASTTNASWDIAVAGDGLGQAKVNEIFDETEMAVYALLEGEFRPNLSYSIGDRYSYGSDYGSTHTPRLGLIYKPQDWVLKALYGAAFRQPSLFELHDEFRGQSDLTPEKIDTYELEANKQLSSYGKIKVNLFFSQLEDSINLIEDITRAGGERYDNIESTKVRGLSSQLDLKPYDGLTLYANYIYLQGATDGNGWGKLAHTASNKLNFGVNWQPLTKTFNINLKANYVGKRKTPTTNTFFDGQAPSYTKLDAVFTWANLYDYQGLSTQIVINNLLDESFFGVGRQAGSSVRDDYDPATNPDPAGFIPPYHPQPGRIFYWNISYRMQ